MFTWGTRKYWNRRNSLTGDKIWTKTVPCISNKSEWYRKQSQLQIGRHMHRSASIYGHHISSDILMKELRLTSYELISLRVAFIARVTSYDLFLLYELRVIFCLWVTSYCLLHGLQVTFYIRVTNYCLLQELWVSFSIRVTTYCLLHELRVIF